jgi:hypothetical protein
LGVPGPSIGRITKYSERYIVVFISLIRRLQGYCRDTAHSYSLPMLAVITCMTYQYDMDVTETEGSTSQSRNQKLVHISENALQVTRQSECKILKFKESLPIKQPHLLFWTVRTLKCRVRIPYEVWMYVSVFNCCVILCRKRLCDWPIPDPRCSPKCIKDTLF